MNGLQLNTNTKAYLENYYKILSDMTYEMTSADLTDSISQNFIALMIPHHRAAIRMSENLLTYSDNMNVRTIARNIITEQLESIDALTAAAPLCTDASADTAVFQCRSWQIIRLMFCQMNCAAADNYINCDFMREMIPHHMGGVRLSQTALCFGVCPELVPAAEGIVTRQKKGIRQMNMLLSEYGCSVRC